MTNKLTCEVCSVKFSDRRRIHDHYKTHPDHRKKASVTCSPGDNAKNRLRRRKNRYETNIENKPKPASYTHLVDKNHFVSWCVATFGGVSKHPIGVDSCNVASARYGHSRDTFLGILCSLAEEHDVEFPQLTNSTFAYELQQSKRGNTGTKPCMVQLQSETHLFHAMVNVGNSILVAIKDVGRGNRVKRIIELWNDPTFLHVGNKDDDMNASQVAHLCMLMDGTRSQRYALITGCWADYPETPENLWKVSAEEYTMAWEYNRTLREHGAPVEYVERSGAGTYEKVENLTRKLPTLRKNLLVRLTVATDSSDDDSSPDYNDDEIEDISDVPVADLLRQTIDHTDMINEYANRPTLGCSFDGNHCTRSNTAPQKKCHVPGCPNFFHNGCLNDVDTGPVGDHGIAFNWINFGFCLAHMASRHWIKLLEGGDNWRRLAENNGVSNSPVSEPIDARPWYAFPVPLTRRISVQKADFAVLRQRNAPTRLVYPEEDSVDSFEKEDNAVRGEFGKICEFGIFLIKHTINVYII